MIDTLGFKNEDRVVIINADDFGLTNASNEAIKKLFQNGAITSSSLMVPCKAAYDAALFCVHDKKSNVGVHLTLTSSENDRHTPVFQDFVLDSLVAEDGCFHSDSRTVEQFAKPEQVMLELRAQIETALGWGVDITHLDSHAGSVLGLFTGRDFLDIVFDLCEQFRLPFHLPKGIVNQPFLRQKQKKSFKKKLSRLLSLGEFCLLTLNAGSPITCRIEKNQIAGIGPGLTQIVTHPAIVNDELISQTPHFLKRESQR